MVNEERRKIIGILEEVLDAADRGETIAASREDMKRLQLMVALANSKHLEGEGIWDASGIALQCDVVSLTTDGRELLGKLREEEYAASMKGKLARWGGQLQVVALSVITAVITAITVYRVERWLQSGR